MSLITWKVKGMNALQWVNDVFKLITKFKPTIVGLVENKLMLLSLHCFKVKS